MPYLNLVKTATPHNRSVPVGLHTNPAKDYWLSMCFEFDAKKTEVVCVSWELTTSFNAAVSLSTLNYNEFQVVADALAEEVEIHAKRYYDTLSDNHYAGTPADRLEEV